MIEATLRDSYNRDQVFSAMQAAGTWDEFRLQYLKLLEVRAEMQLARLRYAREEFERQIEMKAARELAQREAAELAAEAEQEGETDGD
jgi:hypothetical protein